MDRALLCELHAHTTWSDGALTLRQLVDLYGADVYSWVAGAWIPGVASGDVHAAEHIRSWKTLLPCAKDEEELVAFLRAERPAYLVPYRSAPTAEPAAAA